MQPSERGFLSLTLIGFIAAGVIIAGLSIALKIANYRAEKWENAHKTFVAQTEAIGKIAAEKAKAKEKADIESKRRIDNENKSLRASLAAESKRLSDARSGERFLPQGTGSTPSPTVTADRAKLETALRNFDSGVTPLIDRGDEAIADLNAAKTWAKDRAK